MKAFAIALLACALAACGPKSKPATEATTAPAPDTGATGGNDCGDYEHQVELCHAECEDCSGATPGNACNECAEACASKVFCEDCNQADYCED